jgi:hypothetical protein
MVKLSILLDPDRQPLAITLLNPGASDSSAKFFNTHTAPAVVERPEVRFIGLSMINAASRLKHSMSRDIPLSK